MGYWWGGCGSFNWLSMLFFWILVIFVIFTIVRNTNPNIKANGTKSPLDILKERYAKGEITKKDFEDLKKELS